MTFAPLGTASHELQRLEALYRFDILDTLPEAAFDRITRLAQRVFEMPQAFINLIDEERQWTKSCAGFDASEVGRDISFCARAITRPGVMVINDAKRHATFKDNPFVTGDFALRFYAGAPLITKSGYAIGTLCLTDQVPRDFSAAQAEMLEDFAALVVDELELRYTASALRRADDYNEAIVTHAPDIIFTLNTDGSFLSLNPAFEKVLAHPTEVWLGQAFTPIVHPEDRDRAQEAFGRVLAGEQLKIELQILSGSSGARVMEVVAVPRFEAGEVKSVLAFGRDVTERRRAETALKRAHEQLAVRVETLRESKAALEAVNDQLSHDASHDTLTGLANRAKAMEALTDELAKTGTDASYGFALLFLDCDHFKVINDSLGHPAGDALLKALAKRLEACVRPQDLVARLGGDEFILLLRGVTRPEATEEVAARVQAELEKPFKLKGETCRISVSIGIVLSDACTARAEDVLRDADIAMYRAKALGKARYQLFDPDLRERALACSA